MNQFLWLLLLLLGVAFLLRVDFIFYILYVAVGVFAWSRWYAGRALQNLTGERHYRRRAFLGETVEIRLTLVNKSRLALPWVEFHESVPPELRLEQATRQVVTLRGHQTADFIYHIKAQQRGYYQLGPLRLSSGDLFGLARQRHGTLPPDHLTIYPRIIPLAHLGLPSRLPFGTIASRQRLFEDPARPMGVREFRSGDSLRRMNWKASAHTQKLLVRTFQPAISLETAILLDLHSTTYERRDRYTATEWAIVVAASLASHLIDARQSVGLMTNGIDPLRVREDTHEFDEVTGRLLFQAPADKGPAAFMAPAIAPRNGRPQLMKLLEQLARVETAETVPFVEWASPISVGLNWGVTILAITARGDARIANTLHHMARAGFNPILIAVEPDANFALVRERGRRLGFQAFNVTDRRDLTPWQQPQHLSSRSQTR
ncbi:conserved protein of unknown function [Candidatus Promineifilum breve]|uniref:DUF58 domain-containing protein n=1 Tax=Candidatus Promineifilum breve TaxID=1806508 RepID=A0A160SZA9_9CHLR|nr:DUF58 domain-containing protein [Candidatus Promineifilum breve]CUS02464.1 conserved protein of unknown function [Candidatus Promineifilum breve]